MINKIYFESLSSTNDYLKENYQNYSTDTVIIANKQTNGRGRYDRVWVSNDDLTFSILFVENIDKHHNIIAPLSIIYTLLNKKVKADIKWPNDIYVNNQKLCGILIESIINDDKKKCDIVGIGINFEINNLKDSISLNNFNIYDKEDILNQIIENYYFLLKLPLEDLMKLYKIHSLILGKHILYNDISYLIEDIDSNMELILRSDKSKIRLNVNEIDIKSYLEFKNNVKKK